jgi:hypothetical protein
VSAPGGPGAVIRRRDARPAERPRRAWRGLVALAAALLVGGGVRSDAGAAPTPRVYIVIVDGLDARRLTEELTPALFALARGGAHRTTFYPEGRAVMPTVTNTNHAAVVTGTYAAAHGIVGNVFWTDDPGRPLGRAEQARHLQVETLFTVVERERPRLVTGALLGKSRLVGLFSATGRQRRPDVLWGDVATETEAVDPRAGFASDQRTMDETLRTIAALDPDLLLVALPDVDRTAHLFGPDSQAARKALLEADRQIERLVAALRAQGAWERTVLMITADHGFVPVHPDPAAGRPHPMIVFGRELARAGLNEARVVGGGPLETIVLPGPAPRETSAADGARLAEIRALALAQPEIDEAWYRLPNPADGGDAHLLERAHPDWRMGHPRAGELLLLARPGHYFADPFSPSTTPIRGNHGGPDTARIPILLTGGHPWLRAHVVAPGGPVAQAENPDLGVTAAWLLGVRAPRTLEGKPVPRALAGRVLAEAFAR